MSNSKDLVVTRVFAAPIERVWQQWTEASQVMRWWGPQGFTAPVARMDVREGGASLVCMRSPQGQDMYNTWTYQRVVPLQRLEFVLDWADAGGAKIDPTAMGFPPDFPRNVRHVVSFAAAPAGATALTVTEYGYQADHYFDLSKAGLEECLDKMAASLAAA